MGKSASKKVKMGKATMKHKKMSGGGLTDMGVSYTFGRGYSNDKDEYLIRFIKTNDFDKIKGLLDNNLSKYSVDLLGALSIRLSKFIAENPNNDKIGQLLRDVLSEKSKKEKEAKANPSKPQEQKYITQIASINDNSTPDEFHNLLTSILVDGSEQELNILITSHEEMFTEELLNKPNTNGLTPFLLAIINPNDAFWKILYSKFSNLMQIGYATTVASSIPISIQGNEVSLPSNVTILHLAAYLASENSIFSNADVSVITSFIDVINEKDSDGNTALHYAVKRRIILPKIISELLTNGADATLQNNNRETALDILSKIAQEKEIGINKASPQTKQRINAELDIIKSGKQLLENAANEKKTAAETEAAKKAEAAEAEEMDNLNEQARATIKKETTEMYGFLKQLYKDKRIKECPYNELPDDYIGDYSTDLATLFSLIKEIVPGTDKQSFMDNSNYRKEKLNEAKIKYQETSATNALEKARAYYNKSKNGNTFNKPPFLDESGKVKEFDEDAYNNNNNYRDSINKELEIDSDFEEYKKATGTTGGLFGTSSNLTREDFAKTIFGTGAYYEALANYKDKPKPAVWFGGSKKRKNKKAATKKNRSNKHK